MSIKPLHTEPRAARFGEINVVRRGPVNGDVRLEHHIQRNATPKKVSRRAFINATPALLIPAARSALPLTLADSLRT